MMVPNSRLGNSNAGRGNLLDYPTERGSIHLKGFQISSINPNNCASSSKGTINFFLVMNFDECSETQALGSFNEGDQNFLLKGCHDQ
tara:strand:- start:67 stop:327 length:261 start_codon:yes stop_codon:yes gene_type:complete